MKHRIRYFLLYAGTATALISPVSAQVRYFESPPSVEELRATLQGGADGPRTRGFTPRSFKPGNTSRSIEWKGAGLPKADTTQSAQPMAAAPNTPAVAVPIQFGLGSSQIDPRSMPFLRAIADLLAQDKEMQLVIEGHTDGTGSAKRNMVLSWDRALAVYKVLVETYGIDPGRLQPQGRGATEPMQGTSAADAVNRRVQFRQPG